MSKETKTKNIRVSEELHRELKVESAEKNITLEELIEQILNDRRN